MHQYEKNSSTGRPRRNFLLSSLGLASCALLSPPTVLARTLLVEAGSDNSSEASFDQEAFSLWSNRLDGASALTRKSNPAPEEPAFFYYTRDRGFLPVEFDTDGQTELAKMLPDSSANMKLAVNVVRPNHEHLDYIKHNKNGTLAVSIMPFSQAAMAKADSASSENVKAAAGADKPSDHLIASVLPEAADFDYRVSYPDGPSLVRDGAPLHAGLGNWAWTFSVQQKAPKWQAFLTDLQAAVAGQKNSGGSTNGQKPQPGKPQPTKGKPQPKKTTPMDQALKFVQGGAGSWETLSFLGVGLNIFNAVIAKTMSQNGKPHVLLTLPNYQIVTSKAGRQAAAGIAMPLLAGDYVAVPIKTANLLQSEGKKYELYEGVIVPAGSKDVGSALEQALLPTKGESRPGLSYVSFSVKFS